MIICVLSKRASLTGASDLLSLLIVGKVIPRQFNALISVVVGNDFPSRIKHIGKILFVICQKERANPGCLIEAHIVSVFKISLVAVTVESNL